MNLYVTQQRPIIVNLCLTSHGWVALCVAQTTNMVERKQLTEHQFCFKLVIPPPKPQSKSYNQNGKRNQIHKTICIYRSKSA